MSRALLQPCMSDDLFSLRYPATPGSKATDTSAAAGADMASRAGTLRACVLTLLAAEPRTADECASALGESILSIRPRLSELRRMGKITDAGTRRANASGKLATVWRTL